MTNQAVYDGQGRLQRCILPLLPCVVYISVNLLYMCFCTWAVASNHIPSECEQVFHLKRFITLSLTFNGIALFTYLMFSCRADTISSLENARARATALIVLHLAFSVWGTLTWQKLNSACEDIDVEILCAHHSSTAYNGVYFILLFLHECIPHEADWTVMPSFQGLKPKSTGVQSKANLNAMYRPTFQPVMTEGHSDTSLRYQPRMLSHPGHHEPPISNGPSPNTSFNAAHDAWQNQLSALHSHASAPATLEKVSEPSSISDMDFVVPQSLLPPPPPGFDLSGASGLQSAQRRQRGWHVP